MSVCWITFYQIAFGFTVNRCQRPASRDNKNLDANTMFSQQFKSSFIFNKILFRSKKPLPWYTLVPLNNIRKYVTCYASYAYCSNSSHGRLTSFTWSVEIAEIKQNCESYLHVTYTNDVCEYFIVFLQLSDCLSPPMSVCGVTNNTH